MRRWEKIITNAQFPRYKRQLLTFFLLKFPVKLELRYAPSFLEDLEKLDSATKKRILNFVFVEFAFYENLYYAPRLRQIDVEGIFHRFSLENYLVGIEVKGEIVKFLRVIPMPDV